VAGWKEVVSRTGGRPGMWALWPVELTGAGRGAGLMVEGGGGEERTRRRVEGGAVV